MNAVIITPFFNYSYDVRIKYLENTLINKGYNVKIVTTDFDHRTKSKYKINKDNVIQVNVPEYNKNISLRRLISHYSFSRKSFPIIKELEPNVLYVSGPPNSLFSTFSNFKQIKPNCKLIFDVGDIWPETLPISDKLKMYLKPVFKLASAIREKSFKNVDWTILECDYYQKFFNQSIFNKKVIYYSKQDLIGDHFKVKYPSKSVINIVYIGSINNIIDIDKIVEILVIMQKKSEIHFKIIGDGEKRDELIDKCNKYNIRHSYFGNVFSEQRKYEILNDCDFALNIMKPNLEIALTMKSIEYFYWGLALINNIREDTTNLVNEYKCGINIVSSEEFAEKYYNLEWQEIYEMKESSRRTYIDRFSPISFANNIESILEGD